MDVKYDKLTNGHLRRSAAKSKLENLRNEVRRHVHKEETVEEGI